MKGITVDGQKVVFPKIDATFIHPELGDVIVFTFRKGILTREQHQLFLHEMQRHFPDNKVVLLYGEIDVTVVRPEQWADMEKASEKI